MICERCNQRQATTLITNKTGGQKTEVYLCPYCLLACELDNQINGQGWASLFFGKDQQQTQKETCPSCQMTYETIKKEGKLGCPQCYKVFEGEICATLKQLQGQTKHVGKVSAYADMKDKTIFSVEKYKAQLAAAVAKEAFEEAALLRDKIKALQEEVNPHEKMV